MIGLEGREWKAFLLKDIFLWVQRGKRLKKENQKNGSTPYISSTSLNNGVDNFIGNQFGIRKFSDCLTIANSGSVGSAFFHSYSFVASDHVTHLKGENFNKFSYLFVLSILRRLSEKYNFNREINDKRISRERIVLPVTPSGGPDYEFMEFYVKRLFTQKISEYEDYARKILSKIVYKEVPSLAVKDWSDFFVENICDICSGMDIYDEERIDGNRPYISSTARNNGIGYFVNNKNTTLESGCISVNRNGSVGFSFYHPYVALFSNDCRKLRLPEGIHFAGFFLANQISAQRAKYNYGYKMGTARLKRQKIMLPVNENGVADFDYMEQYAKNIYYNKISQYLDYLEYAKSTIGI